jgi:hypothetical protein
LGFKSTVWSILQYNVRQAVECGLESISKDGSTFVLNSIQHPYDDTRKRKFPLHYISSEFYSGQYCRIVIPEVVMIHSIIQQVDFF